MGAAGVLRHVAPQGADTLAGWIGGVVEVVRFGRFGELEVDDARLDNGQPIDRIELENALHARERDDDTPKRGDGAAAQSSARASWHDRQRGVQGDAHYVGHLSRARWEDDGLRLRLLDRAVVLEGDHFLGAPEDAIGANSPLQSPDHPCVDGLGSHGPIVNDGRVTGMPAGAGPGCRRHNVVLLLIQACSPGRLTQRASSV